eukprot:GFUD01037690.1.p1 GENE.GFUD01037690.1~~GFUD01037690.1.p1  ORF type:complete len:617 (+),score=161.08 GFUD01037690.1:261-1853(+)
MPAPQDSVIACVGKPSPTGPTESNKQLKLDPSTDTCEKTPNNQLSQEKSKICQQIPESQKTPKLDLRTETDRLENLTDDTDKCTQDIPEIKLHTNLQTETGTTINQDKQESPSNPMQDNNEIVNEKYDSIKEGSISPNIMTNQPEDAPYYARMTIIDDCNSHDNSISDEHKDNEQEELIHNVPLKEYNRSISEPPDESKYTNSNSTRKLSEGEAKNQNLSGLTGLFFQKLIQTEEGEQLSQVYRSNSSLASLASQDSSRSDSRYCNPSPRPSLSVPTSQSRNSLNPGDLSGHPSPSLSAKFGSGEMMFSINKHKKVDLTSFDQPAQHTIPRKRETRFSHGEDKAPEAFESNMIKKAASIAHVESFTKTIKTGTMKGVDKLDVNCDKFEGKLLLNWFTSCFNDDNYLKISLTSQDFRFIARQFGNQLISLGVLKCCDSHENYFKEDGVYCWSTGEMKVPRKSSWKMSAGVLPTVPAEEGCVKSGAKYTEAEFQQALMGLRREHKENIEKMRKDQDEALFKVRGEQAESMVY